MHVIDLRLLRLRPPYSNYLILRIEIKCGLCKLKKKALYLSVKVFNTKVLIGDTIFTSPPGDRTAILSGHPSHAKV